MGRLPSTTIHSGYQLQSDEARLFFLLQHLSPEGTREFAQLPRSDGPQRRRPWSDKLGVVLLSDGAGEVAAIGEGVSRAKIGDPVAGYFHPRWFGGPIKRNRKYGAEMHILMRDIDLAVAQGEELGVPMWVCEAARLVFKRAIHKGAAREDLTAIVKHIERDAGFEMPKTR